MIGIYKQYVGGIAMYAIEMKQLSKCYGQKLAVGQLNLSIKEGELFSLLGVNGAGKTTTIRMLTGLSRPSDGDAFIYSKSVLHSLDSTKKIVNLSPQETAIAGNLTVRENLIFMAEIYGFNPTIAKVKVEKMEKEFALQEVMNTRAKILSGGWQRRLSIAMALITEPKVLFLDEPTSGVDVITRRDFWNHITSLAKKGVTILVTTHFMDEAEYCDRISLFYKGETIALGTPEELKRKAMELNPSPQPSPARRSIRQGEGELPNMEETFIRLIKESEAK